MYAYLDGRFTKPAATNYSPDSHAMFSSTFLLKEKVQSARIGMRGTSRKLMRSNSVSMHVENEGLQGLSLNSEAI
mgnify:CR=1